MTADGRADTRTFLSRLLGFSPKEPSLAEQPKQLTKPPVGDIGWDGTPRQGGRFIGPATEHNAKLDFERWRGDYTTAGIGLQMYREDPIVRAIVMSYIAPMLDAPWTMEPGDPDNPDARSYASAAEEMILEDEWQATLRDAVLCIRDGVRLQEIVARYEPDRAAKTFKQEGRKWMPVGSGPKGLFVFDLMARLPSSIDQWVTNPDGTFGGIEQYYIDDDTTRKGQPKIPASKLLRYTYQGEGQNWVGDPLIRACWGGWQARREIMKHLIIGAQRWGTGIPVIQQTEPHLHDADATYQKALIVAERMRAGQYERVGMPYGLELKVLESGSNTGEYLRDLYDQIGRDMARSCGCMHLYTGDNSGSYALMEEQTSLFMLNMGHLQQTVIEPINALLQRWTAWNGWDVELAPRLSTADSQATDTGKLSEMITQAKAAGIFTSQIEDEVWLREMIGAPEMSSDTEETWSEKVKAREEMLKNPPPQPGATGAPGGAPPAQQPPKPGDVEPTKRFSDEPVTPLGYARSLGPVHLLAESYFLADQSRMAREVAISRIARNTNAVVQSLASDYAERLAAASLKTGAKVKFDTAALAAHLDDAYQATAEIGRKEVQAEISAQEADPDYARKFTMAFRDLTTEDRALLADPVDPKKKVKKVGPDGEESTLNPDDEREFMAATSAQSIAAQVTQAGTAQKQAAPAASAQEILQRINSVVTDRVIERQVTPDANGTYSTGRLQQMSASDVKWGVYTLTPELGVNGPHDPCEVCEATARHSDNPFQMDSPTAWMFDTPNAECESTNGPHNYCWCTVIGLTQPPEGTR